MQLSNDILYYILEKMRKRALSTSFSLIEYMTQTLEKEIDKLSYVTHILYKRD